MSDSVTTTSYTVWFRRRNGLRNQIKEENYKGVINVPDGEKVDKAIKKNYGKPLKGWKVEYRKVA